MAVREKETNGKPYTFFCRVRCSVFLFVADSTSSYLQSVLFVMLRNPSNLLRYFSFSLFCVLFMWIRVLCVDCMVFIWSNVRIFKYVSSSWSLFYDHVIRNALKVRVHTAGLDCYLFLFVEVFVDDLRSVRYICNCSRAMCYDFTREHSEQFTYHPAGSTF